MPEAIDYVMFVCILKNVGEYPGICTT